ncbi:hypothetical protein MSAN_00216100 [Mycena sanguinolenta]|uniref:Uncharacterized protein n=1 Tax=Mycena sanguinolenta TaxID=230812 RepID=A0A8H7DML4_9AGAR|nr:hypothetical protein MSAN_00216100 [Mycena sanguinolenta]
MSKFVMFGSNLRLITRFSGTAREEPPAWMVCKVHIWYISSTLHTSFALATAAALAAADADSPQCPRAISASHSHSVHSRRQNLQIPDVYMDERLRHRELAAWAGTGLSDLDLERRWIERAGQRRWYGQRRGEDG